MPYSSPASVSDGNVAPASWGNSVKAATDFLANPPACRVYHNTTQSAGTGGYTTMTFNSERFDTDTMHDTATNPTRITIKTAGLYVLHGNVDMNTGTTSERIIQFLINGVMELALDRRGPNPSGGNNILQTSTLWKFAVNDYVELRVYQASGAPVTVVASSAGFYGSGAEFSAVWVGLG